MRIFLPLLALLALLASSHSTAIAADSEFFTSAKYGFRIKRQAEPWALSEPQAPAGAKYALKIGKTDGKTETSVTVYIADAGEIRTSAAARDSAEKKWKTEPKLSNFSRGSGQLAGENSAWLRAEYDIGTKYVLRQHFLLRNDFIYILQCAAPRDEFDAAQGDFSSILATLEFIELDKNAPDLEALAAKCGSEIQWCASWAEAAARAEKENKLVLVLFEVYRGVVNIRIAPSQTFMDEDVVELVNERFVALQWTDATNAPFDSPKVYGLGPSTFGQCVLYANAKGEIVGQAVSYNPIYFYARCLELLKLHPGAAAKDAQDAGELLRRGDLDAADKLLASPSDARDWRMRANLERKRRAGEKACEALKKARELGDRHTIVEEGVIRLRMGQYAKAEDLLKGDSPEAQFWYAMLRGMQKGADAARPGLAALAKHPESRFAWRAAATLLLFNYAPVMSDPRWPDDAHMAACAQPTVATAELSKARQDAIAFLIKVQRQDGAWLSPMSLSAEVSNPAIAAICAEGLLPQIKREDAPKAVERALKLILKAQLSSESRVTFNYMIWSQIFALRFMARCINAGVGDKAKLLEKMNAVISELGRTQQPGGGWSYVAIEGRGDNTIGFVTAAALCAMHEAVAAGAKAAPASVLNLALDAIDASCKPRGCYRYMNGAADKEAEASLRAPLYALALLRYKRGDVAKLTAALEIYLKHHAYTRKERGKGLCHTGPEGFASYYLLYGYSFAAEAVAELPEGEREKFRAALIEDTLYLRLEDGSFCDNAMMGRHYGAGMALHVLNSFAEK